MVHEAGHFTFAKIFGMDPSRDIVNKYLGGTAILAFRVEKSPPKAIPAARRINGNPRIPAVFIASANGADAVANAAISDVGTIPTRNH